MGKSAGSEPKEEPWVGLAKAVNAVRAELESAREQAEQAKLSFEVGPVEMEFAVDVREDRNSSGGVDVRVLSLGREKSVGRTGTHRLTITLHPRDGETKEPVRISDEEPGLPPR